MDSQGYSSSKRRKLEARELCVTGQYCLPKKSATRAGQVILSGANGTSWEDVVVTESKGDLLYFSTLPREFSYTDGISMRNLANTIGNLGSLTIPAATMRVGDVYTMRVSGQFRCSKTSGPIFFRFQVKADDAILADTNVDTVKVEQSVTTELDPTVPFELEARFAVRSDPLTPTVGNVYPFVKITWSDYPVTDGKSYFVQAYPAPALSWDNNNDISLSAYGLILSNGDAKYAFNRIHCKNNS
jgi:hypothetical protein